MQIRRCQSGPADVTPAGGLAPTRKLLKATDQSSCCSTMASCNRRLRDLAAMSSPGGLSRRFRLWHTIIGEYDNFDATGTRSATPASPWASRRAPSRPSACLPEEPSSTSQAAHASRFPRPATSPRERHPSSQLVETTFRHVRVVVQTDQQPRSRIGEQHVFAVLVTVVRRRHRRPASALVARVYPCDKPEHRMRP